MIEAICASCSIPFVFQPVNIDDDYYVDGGVLECLPTSVAKNLGAKVIVGVDVSNSRAYPLKKTSILRRIPQIIIGDNIEKRACKEDILIKLDFSNEAHLVINEETTLRFYELGKKATEKVLPKIRELIKKST